MAGPCDSVTRLLSPYVDDELSGSNRAAVEAHLHGCETCQRRLVEVRATSAAMASYLARRVEGADFSGFTQKVMGRLAKERLPLAERLRLGWAELMAYHAAAIYSAFGAAAMAAAAVLWVLAPGRARVDASNLMVVNSLNVEDPRYEPVVLRTDDGEAVILMVEQQADGQGEVGQPKSIAPPHGGNL